MLSWIFPFRIQNVEGKITRRLEISLEKGKKVLNAGEVNYSFGTLHDVFRIALQKAKIIEHPPAKVLVLGLGAGSIVSIIVEEFGQHPEIIGVEGDPVVVQLAKREFDIERFSNLEIENVLAENFVVNCNVTFDLIAVDVFVEAHVPAEIKSKDFLSNLFRLLNVGGRVVFNEMPEQKFGAADEFPKNFKKQFDNAEMQELRFGDSPNRIFIGYKK